MAGFDYLSKVLDIMLTYGKHYYEEALILLKTSQFAVVARQWLPGYTGHRF